MGLTVIGKASEIIPLQLQVNPRAPLVFPRAKVFDESGVAPISVVVLSHVEDGLYRGAFLVPSPDKFLVSFEVFSDAGHTAEITDDFDVSTDLVVADLDPLPAPGLRPHSIDPSRLP